MCKSFEHGAAQVATCLLRQSGVGFVATYLFLFKIICYFQIKLEEKVNLFHDSRYDVCSFGELIIYFDATFFIEGLVNERFFIDMFFSLTPTVYSLKFQFIQKSKYLILYTYNLLSGNSKHLYFSGD